MPNQIQDAQEAVAPSIPAPPIAASPARILIADDDAAIRQLLDDLLQEDGYTVITTGNGH